MYGNSDLGYKMYPKKMGVKVVRASSMVYLTEEFLKSYINELQHSFVSSEGKCESYNKTFIDSEETQVFKTFLQFNPEVGRRFQSKNNHDGCSDEDEGEGLSQMHELGRKMLSAGFYNRDGLKVVTIEIIEIVTTIIVTTFKRCNNLNML